MSGVAVAIGASAVIGAISSERAGSKAAKATGKAADTAAAETRRSADEAREDLFKLFPAAQQNAQQGFQGALDVFGQVVPAQQQAFQGGNLAAQQQILAGLPQIQNAILGNQVDFSQLQPFQSPQQDLSFLQQQLPQFIDPFAPQPSEMTVNPIGGSSNILGGRFDFNGISPILGGPNVFNRKIRSLER
jgi:hypothetical protein